MECSNYARIPLGLAAVAGLTERCFRVLIVLSTSAGTQGRTWIGNSTIAEWAKLQVNHVQDALKRLADLGLIERPTGKRSPQNPLVLRLFDPIPVEKPAPGERRGRAPAEAKERTPVHPQIGGPEPSDENRLHPQIGGLFTPKSGACSPPNRGCLSFMMKRPLKDP